MENQTSTCNTTYDTTSHAYDEITQNKTRSI